MQAELYRQGAKPHYLPKTQLYLLELIVAFVQAGESLHRRHVFDRCVVVWSLWATVHLRGLRSNWRPKCDGQPGTVLPLT